MAQEKQPQHPDLISVIIPCYNDGKYLDDSIGSILQQTYTNWEVIVVNDGSTDTFTLSKLDSISHPRIKVLHKANGHLSSARNYGIAAASGSVIVTLDADDKFRPAFLEKGLEVLKKRPEVGVVTCFLESFGLKKYAWKPRGGDIKNFLFRQECCASAMFRRECWHEAGGYDENMKSGYEDWEFWIRVTSLGWKVEVVKEFLLQYRVTEKSMLLTVSEPIRNELVGYILEKHHALYLANLKDAVTNRKIIDLRGNKIRILLMKNLFWSLVYPTKLTG